MTDTYGGDFITKILFTKSAQDPKITLYSTDGVFTIMRGPVASTFNAHLYKAFQEAEKVRAIIEEAERIGTEDAQKRAGEGL